MGGDGGGLAVWIDDRHPIFRRGLAACLAAAGHHVVGESSGLDPGPDLSRADVVVFEGEPSSIRHLLRAARSEPTRLVAVVAGTHEAIVFDAIEGGVSAVLLRDGIEADGLVAAVCAAASGATSLPSAMLPGILDRAATVPLAGSRSLTDRELDVLRLLSEGDDTSQIGDSLGYSDRTVKNIVHDLLMKMNCRNRVHVVATATRQGLI